MVMVKKKYSALLLLLMSIFAFSNIGHSQWRVQVKLGCAPVITEFDTDAGLDFNVQFGYHFNWGTIGLQTDMIFTFYDIAGGFLCGIGPDYRYGFGVGKGEIGVMAHAGVSILTLTGTGNIPGLKPSVGGLVAAGVDYSYPVLDFMDVFGDFYVRYSFFGDSLSYVVSLPISVGVRFKFG